MGSAFLLHALVPAGGGVQLWAEKVAGRQIVMRAEDIPAGQWPDELRAVLAAKPLRSRGQVLVSTPSGKPTTLAIPTAAWVPEQSIALLEHLRRIAADPEVCAGLSPEVIFLIDLFEYVEATVKAGRVMVRMERQDQQWHPRFTLATAGEHSAVFNEFRQQLPVVLARNGNGDVVGDAADDWAHWMAVSLITDRARPPEYEELHSPLVTDLLAGRATAKAGPATVSALNEWRSSARDAATQLVFRLTDPADAREVGELVASSLAEDRATANREREQDRAGDDAAKQFTWRLEVGLSVDGAPAESVNASTTGNEQARRIQQRLHQAAKVWPRLGRHLGPVDRWATVGRWVPPEAAYTGDPALDRQLAFSVDLDDVADLLDTKASRLQEAGFPVMIPRAWAPKTTQVGATFQAVGSGPGSGKLGMDQLLDFEWNLSVDGTPVGESDKLELMSSARQIVQVNGQFVFLDKSSLSKARGWLNALTDAAEKDAAELSEVTLAELLEAEAAAEAHRGENPDHNIRVDMDGWVRQLFDRENVVAPARQVELPATVLTELREHQRRGVNWLAWMAEHGLGAILADDMGLGKTLQVLALLAWEKEESSPEGSGEDATGPTLVVAPTSVLAAWQSEATRHIHGFSVLVDHGAGKVTDAEFPEHARQADLVVTSYGTVARNPERYQKVRWRRVVADEAQNIKNPATKQSRAVRGIPANHHIALTGTPVENRLSDLYALMDFANPGILGSAAAFQNRLAIPIERYQDVGATERLKRIVEPFILRRLKTDPAVGVALPEKREHVETVPLSAEQASLYQAYIAQVEEALEQGSASRRGLILASLVKIKQICNHPAHFAGDGSGILRGDKHRSPKIERIFELIGQAVAEGKKVLLFTQFPSFGRMLAPAIEAEYGMPVLQLDGSVSRSRRTELVAQFQRDTGPGVMLLSVRAGGTGITLTRASVVIHIDRWWNPAVEDQATDRAYRIGQERDVDVYKFVSAGTLDERIHEIITGKRDLAGSVVGEGEGWIASLSDEDLAELWQLRESSDVSAADATSVATKVPGADNQSEGGSR
ncbi:MAG: DNA/RNA helicase [Corynebacterium urealyticum]|uniref:DNA/RNA helicase n=1 Tax=Corynebacterium urealyticum TaxID=43771 RepID=A0A2W5BC91_9CORY|nr:MAG: DNA/RNA helicase [Corynebacterium urealyticum]